MDLSAIWDWLLGLASDGLWVEATWWQIVLFTLVTTHITIAAVTVFLHRAQAHRALELHAIPSHFFRFWLWLNTGMVTKEWVAIHRKHHAKCETTDDPHSPVTRGIRTVLLQGSELYRTEAKNTETLSKFGHNTPDDWIERNLYSRFTMFGVSLLMVIDVLLFGAIGATVWAVQMLWIPITAAGIINGIGHWWGYRNFEAPDASANIVPWGVIIGGEELHNNHHTYPTSAKLSVKPFEFDIGWAYIRILEALGLAQVRKTPPRLEMGVVRGQADAGTLEALIANRYEVMAQYAKQVRRVCAGELAKLRSQGLSNGVRGMNLKMARRWLHRDDDKIPQAVKPQLQSAMAEHPMLAKLVAMREELRALWTRTNVSPSQLVADLQAWCRKAEESGIAMLQDFALRLRAAQAA
ncbi:MAG TPA: fatty acid desaturase [Burkholderiaceae bacterium]|nr:fatty acid desaturase [Burkholderiaceae bacterium]